VADRFELLRSANYPECSPTITKLTVVEWTVTDMNPVNWTFSDVAPLLRDELWIAVRKRLERWKEWAMIGWKKIKNSK
jgi:hypothetical protein